MAENLRLVEAGSGRSATVLLLDMGLDSLAVVDDFLPLLRFLSSTLPFLFFLSDPLALLLFLVSALPDADTEPARSDVAVPEVPSGRSFFFLPRRCCRYSHVRLYRAQRLHGSSGSSDGKHLICRRSSRDQEG